MPQKKKSNYKRNGKKKNQDAKQNAKIAALEKFVYKTLENKQVNQYVTPYSVNTAGTSWGDFLTLNIGAADGSATGDAARVGDSVTLMKQVFHIGLQASSTDSYNRMRVIIVEGLENQNIALSDMLTYSSYSLYGNLVFSSPYTTKTATSKRYKVHFDKVIELNSNARGATRDFKHVIKYRQNGSPGKVLMFDGPTSSVPTNHNIRILAISDSVSVDHPNICWNVRSTYKDA